MEIKVNFRSKIPLYIQIIEQIKEQILTSNLIPGEQLPTVRTLAGALGVNFNTVARAYRGLDQMGLISTQLGRGSYVLGLIPDILATKHPEDLQLLALRYIKEAQRSGFSIEEIKAAVLDV